MTPASYRVLASNAAALMSQSGPQALSLSGSRSLQDLSMEGCESENAAAISDGLSSKSWPLIADL